MRTQLFGICVLGMALLFATGCKEEDDEDDGTCDMEAPECDAGLTCAEIQGGEPMCVAPVHIAGMVLSTADDSPIEGALVQAKDGNGAAVGTSAVTDADGTYMLAVPAARNAEGTPLESQYTLAAQAQGFEMFPTAVRPALPVDAVDSTPEEEEDAVVAYTIENPITTIKLIPKDGDASTLGVITGTIAGDDCQGVLVVAEAGDDAGLVGFANSECLYTIFNVPAGTYTVMGYAQGLQLQSAEATVAEGGTSADVNLAASDAPLSTVSGSVNIVNAPGGSVTSVILAVASTFTEGTPLVQVPPGLRVGEITGEFTFENVPDGEYVVLAAYENDLLVRDPDLSIGGTDTVYVTVPSPDSGNDVVLPESFKVTEALAVVYPGADEPDQVDGDNLTLEWADDSGEQQYEVRVIDALGNPMWETIIDGVSGSATVTLDYAGEPLEEGMYYQFKVWSIDNGGDYISTTEDLLGVFYL